MTRYLAEMSLSAAVILSTYVTLAGQTKPGSDNSTADICWNTKYSFRVVGNV